MARYVLVVHVQHLEGREDDFAKWYDDVHIPEILESDGFVSAQRFSVLSDPAPRNETRPTMVTYEIETDDMAATVAEFQARTFTGTDSMDASVTSLAWFQPASEVQYAK